MESPPSPPSTLFDDVVAEIEAASDRGAFSTTLAMNEAIEFSLDRTFGALRTLAPLHQPPARAKLCRKTKTSQKRGTSHRRGTFFGMLSGPQRNQEHLVVSDADADADARPAARIGRRRTVVSCEGDEGGERETNNRPDGIVVCVC